MLMLAHHFGRTKCTLELLDCSGCASELLHLGSGLDPDDFVLATIGQFERQ